MGNCPNCGAVVNEDFGLAECTKCKAQLIVHMDGRVEVQGEEPPPLAAEAELEPPPEVFPPQSDEFENQFAAEAEPPAESDLNLELGEEAPLALDQALEEEPIEPPPPPSEEVVPEEVPFDGNEPVAHSEEPQVYRSPGAAADSPNLSDLADFANSEESGGREGPLRYTLLIAGIDTADVREAFREALTDRKFMWDIEQILRGIRQGNVRIENVPPGKAYILVNRLRNLPLKIRWEQNAIVQP